MTVGFDLIHECSGPAEELLQAFGLQLTSSLQPPESIGNFGEHQLRRQNQFSLENRLLESSCLRRAFDDPHHRGSIQHQAGQFQRSRLNAPCPRESVLAEMAQMRLSFFKAASSARACRRRSRESPPQASCKSIRACWLKLRPSLVGSQIEECRG